MIHAACLSSTAHSFRNEGEETVSAIDDLPHPPDNVRTFPRPSNTAGTIIATPYIGISA
jgi:hypothetical protein